MRAWSPQCCKMWLVFGLFGVSLATGCNQASSPALVAPVRVAHYNASPLDARSFPDADHHGAAPVKGGAVVAALPLAATSIHPVGSGSASARAATSASPMATSATETGATWPETVMVTVPQGRYRPFFPGKDEPALREVSAFRLDVTPVTVAAFRDFVRAHPAWRRGTVPRLFADIDYLRPWRSDVDPGVAPDTVATHVSWFAARAYCRAQNKRLPAMKEWERAALASASGPDGRADPTFNARILRWYGHPSRGRPGPIAQKAANFFGLKDLHGLVWEWVEDFNTALVTGESRADSALERGLYCGAGSIGAADPSDYAAFMRFALRSSLKAAYTTGSLGFRCAADVPSGGKK